MAYDLLIKNGTIIDGKGTPRFHANVTTTDGKIVAIGIIDDDAISTIDATKQIVSRGFIDPHTHYDAQIT
jgi:N-acyl-D-amino-acid deacylase